MIGLVVLSVGWLGLCICWRPLAGWLYFVVLFCRLAILLGFVGLDGWICGFAGVCCVLD